MDFYLSDTGDIQRSTSGDIALTPTQWRDDLQQAYVRVMTDAGDFVLYQDLGASLSKLYGMPQTPETGNFGCTLIKNALDREGRFRGRPFTVDAIPTGYQTIRFDISITSGLRDHVTLSVQQSLGG